MKPWLALVAGLLAACEGAHDPLPAPQAKLMMQVANLEPAEAPRSTDVVRPAIATTFASQPRSRQGFETEIDGVTYDAALDCVAKKIHDLSDPERYAAVAQCGSPLVVNDTRTVDNDEVAKTVQQMRDGTDADLAMHIGTYTFGDRTSIVSAPAEITLEPFHAGDREIRGASSDRWALSAEVSSGGGVTAEKLQSVDGKFAFDVAAFTDADIEIVGYDEEANTNQVFARIRIGDGSPLFAVRGSLLERANSARARLGLTSLKSAPGLGTCDSVPAMAAGIDLSSVATCEQIQTTWSEVLARQIAYSPSFQSALLLPRGAVLETGANDASTAGYRLMSRFEELSATAMHARVLQKLRDKWGSLTERPVPHDALEIALLAVGKPPAVPFGSLTAKLQRIGNTWSKTKKSYAAIVSARDLSQAIDKIDTDWFPDEIAFATRQVRGTDGAMYHVIAIVASR